MKELTKQIPYKWRVQSSNAFGATCVAYVDARDVQKLLDEVVGQAFWQSDFKEVKGNLFAGIGIRVNNEWIWKWDCGVESNVEKEKGEASDSFKRAAVQWGIGRFLYDLEIVRLPTQKDDKGKYHPYSKAKHRFIKSAAEITAWCNMITNKNGQK